MSRVFKIFLGTILVLFVLACNLITKPIKDVQDIASTAESFATSMPVETLKALATQIPVQTLEAFPSSIPDFGNYFDPKGTPVEAWKDVPVMSEATVGQEFGDNTYSFKANVTAKDVQDFYNGKMIKLGWSQSFSMPAESEGTILVFQKESKILTVTAVPLDNEIVVILTLAG